MKFGGLLVREVLVLKKQLCGALCEAIVEIPHVPQQLKCNLRHFKGTRRVLGSENEMNSKNTNQSSLQLVHVHY